MDAVRKGCKKLIVGIGGSATNDVGIGMLQALGASFTDINDQEVSYGAEGIENIAAMDITGILKKLKDVDIKVICDVNNPLVGDEGCSTVFAPQKGADLQMVQRMEQAITRQPEDLAMLLHIFCMQSWCMGLILCCRKFIWKKRCVLLIW